MGSGAGDRWILARSVRSCRGTFSRTSVPHTPRTQPCPTPQPNRGPPLHTRPHQALHAPRHATRHLIPANRSPPATRSSLALKHPTIECASSTPSHQHQLISPVVFFVVLRSSERKLACRCRHVANRIANKPSMPSNNSRRGATSRTSLGMACDTHSSISPRAGFVWRV
jgi:hypothetical protein